MSPDSHIKHKANIDLLLVLHGRDMLVQIIFKTHYFQFKNFHLKNIFLQFFFRLFLPPLFALLQVKFCCPQELMLPAAPTTPTAME